MLSLVGVIHTSRSAQKVNDAILQTQMKTIMEQIKALELKQDKHNQVIERMYIIERTQGEAQRDMKTLYNAVDEVKEDMGHLHTAIDEIKEKEIRLEGRIGQP